MGVAGWTFRGNIPNVAKAVIIVAPHTSNWDFVIGAAAMLALDLDLRFLGKHTLFDGPLAPMMRALGGIPVDRSQPGSGVVDRMIEFFSAEEQLILALAPEGTRGKVTRWRTGFHSIAAGAAVPIVPVALDYGRRTIFLGPPTDAGEDLEADLAGLRAFFANAAGRRPLAG
jgi:1-acyl-sn-glycerol-3-phosphate acyltransferase